MNDDSILGAAIGQLGQTVKKVGQQIIKVPEEMSKDLGGQIGGKPVSSAENSDPEQKQQWKSDEERVRFLKDLYGSAKQNSPTDSQDKSTSFAKASAVKPEEQKALMELRSQLHKENYYDPTFNPVKKQEERPAEKVENEKKEEMMDLQKKEEKKPQPLAVVREQNKAEQFRGAAG